MDFERANAASAALAQTLDELIEPGPPETLYLTPIFRSAIAAAHKALEAATDPESKIVARATRDNLERALAERRAIVGEPLASSYEIRDLLRACVAGQGLSPA